MLKRGSLAALFGAFAFAAAAAAADEPVLAFRFGENDSGRLVRLDPETFEPRGPGMVLSGYGSGWSFSPDRLRLVLGHGQLAELLFVDARSLRPSGIARLGLGVRGRVAATAWVGGRALALVRAGTGGWHLVAVDAATRRVVARRDLAGKVVGFARSRGRVVVLLAPSAGIGPARLVVAGAQLELRSITLARITVGTAYKPAPHFFQPGLAADAARAYVVAAGPPLIATVDLATLRVDYNVLRMRALAAAAKLAFNGPQRSAHVLPNGLLAVTGSNEHAFRANGNWHIRSTPAGLTLIDPSDWSARRLDETSTAALIARNVLLAWGYAWDSQAQRATGDGVAGYEFDGAGRFRALAGEPVVWVQAAGNFALARAYGPTARFVPVDVRTGQPLAPRPGNLPVVLTGDAQPFWG
jgi:hypothetical protein